MHLTFSRSEPLKFFKTLNFLILQDFTTVLIKFLAIMIFFSLKFSKLEISIKEYSNELLKAKALFAGIVHGVVVHIIILASLRNSLSVFLILKAT